MGRMTMVCSICGADVHRTEENNPANPHENAECGTWDQLVGELQRMHNLEPEQTEESLRVLIRTTYRYENGGPR